MVHNEEKNNLVHAKECYKPKGNFTKYILKVSLSSLHSFADDPETLVEGMKALGVIQRSWKRIEMWNIMVLDGPPLILNRFVRHYEKTKDCRRDLEYLHDIIRAELELWSCGHRGLDGTRSEAPQGAPAQ